MAIVPMQKISLLVHKENKPKVVGFLQSRGVLHIEDIKTELEGLEAMDIDKEGHELEMSVAQLDFVIKFLSKYETRKKGIQAAIDGDQVNVDIGKMKEIVKSYKFKEIVIRAESAEEQLVDLHNEEKASNDDLEKLMPWRHLKSDLGNPRETRHVSSLFVIIPTKDWEAFKTELIAISPLLILECDNIYQSKVYVHIICDHSVLDEVNGLIANCKAERAELPETQGSVKNEIERVKKRLKEISDRQGQLNSAAKELSKELEKLRMVYDYMNWKLLQKQARRRFMTTGSTVLISGWMPRKGIDSVKKELEKITKNFELSEVESEEGESPPVLLEHKRFLKPFRAVTDVYGLPLYHEPDPTPYLAVFFIIYFGMCLTDAGYGLIMFATTWAVLKYLKIPKGMETLVRLLMYGGIVTFIMGILFGGWFGLTPDQAPSFMTTMSGDRLMFKGQVFDALNNAMTVLILSLILGFIQTLFGVWLNFIHNFRNINKREALLNNLPWAYLLTMIGLFIVGTAGLLPGAVQSIILIFLYIGFGAVVVTQGRKKSNIVAKVMFGVLSLYDLVGYMSDVLSYSRLLALGLATAIIGMAVNTIAILAGGIPYVGIIVMIVILIGGHIFNLGINALGSFIHSGRLQFVEFFGKFLEGGGVPFSPLSRKSRYVNLER